MSHDPKQNTEKTKQFNQQRNKLIFKTATAQHTLEYVVTTGMLMMFLLVLWMDADMDADVNVFIKGFLWLLIFGATVIGIWGAKCAIKNAVSYCKEGEGRVAERLAFLKKPEPYTFYKTGDHLLHLVVSGIIFLATSFTETSMPIAQTILSVLSLTIFVLTITVMCQAVGKANRYKAEQANKTKES